MPAYSCHKKWWMGGVGCCQLLIGVLLLAVVLTGPVRAQTGSADKQQPPSREQWQRVRYDASWHPDSFTFSPELDLTTATFMDLKLVFFGSLATRLESDEILQSALVEAVISRRQVYHRILNEAMSKDAYASLLQRLLVEGAHHLDAARMFALLDESYKSHQGAIRKVLMTTLVAGVSAKPEELEPALEQAMKRRGGSLVVPLWNAARPEDRTRELFDSIFNGAAEMYNIYLLLNLAMAEPDFENRYTLTPHTKRLAAAWLYAEEIAAQLMSHAPGEVAPNIDDEEDYEATRESQQKDLGEALRDFIKSSDNPFYFKAQLMVLQEHLITKLKGHALQLTPEAVSAACLAWVKHYQSYGVPPALRTHN